MNGAARRDEILRMVRRKGYVSVSEAAQALGVDTSTVRRDLARLDHLGLVERSHGGALPVRDEDDIPFDVKMGRLVPEKQAIGRLAASLVPDGAAMILDSGSTSLMVAQALAGHRDLTVITPDIRVAAELITRPDVRLIVPGGEGVASTTTVVSQEAVESMRRFHVDVAVMGADAVDVDGATNMNGTVIPLKRAMLGAARRAVLVMDSSKFGVRRLVKVAPLDQFDEIVTDDGLAEEIARAYPVPVRRAPVAREGQVPA
ncbi:DeoR/GlpR family DNA-binding transcription regulator [Georgenia sp. 10Sc9-8]|uniref:Lactose phosphotransferase system repressor n=1 Tax=Georgenia halotolerans TaxID=3028317 RepID=A0ABT5U0A6_9MICO|nr:DeoR/GlpR family DNA-binding transcription regulator [Georgenia halotolerans]